MVIRVKFTAVPGEQWILRREVYRLVQELLRREGIRFARPVVSVQLEGDESPQDKMPLAAAGAAAAQSLEDTADAEDDAAKAR